MAAVSIYDRVARLPYLYKSYVQLSEDRPCKGTPCYQGWQIIHRGKIRGDLRDFLDTVATLYPWVKRLHICTSNNTLTVYVRTEEIPLSVRTLSLPSKGWATKYLQNRSNKEK